uniref:Perilipin n=1 Tax=Anas zonorhyncha TaxID=75864 RepID=A0A8B9UXZ9_9AVES
MGRSPGVTPRDTERSGWGVPGGAGCPGGPPKRQHQADPAPTTAKSSPAPWGDLSGGRSAPAPKPLPHPKTSPTSGSGASGCPRKLVGGSSWPPKPISVPCTAPAAMSAETMAPVETEREAQSVVSRVANLALVSSARGAVSTAYASTKESHPYVRSVCDVAEKGVKTLTAAAVSGAQPLLTKLEPQISTANEYACKGLDKLEEKLPILQQPTEKLISDTKQLVTSTVTGAKDVLTSTVAGAKDAVSSRVTGVMDMTKGAVQGSVELTKSAVSSGVSTVMGSAMGQMVVSGVGSVLEKSEELVDHYLPMTDEELAKLATAVEGFEPEQQKQQQSYFVRLGSLSAKLRHRALQHSLGKLQSARHSSQDVLAQLQRTLDLVEQLKQGMDQKLQGGQEKLQQLWLEWSKKQPGGGKDLVPPEGVESGALAMVQGLTQQLQSACQPLVSSLQGLPAGIQDTAGQVRHNVEELRASLASATSLQEVTGSVLAKARTHAAKARELMDELVEHVAHNTPLSWLVGPFTPSTQHLLGLQGQ